jgi:proline dehydrogenase
MLRSFFIYLSKAAWAQKLFTNWSFAWRAASRFVAGETAVDAIRAIRELNEKCINATLDHLGEHTSTVDEADKATEDILHVLDEIDKAVRSNVSIKLTQIGMGLDEEICRQNLVRILEQVKKHGNYVRIDMEDTPYTDTTLSLFYSMLQRGFNVNHVGMVVQSYLIRADVRKL